MKTLTCFLVLAAGALAAPLSTDLIREGEVKQQQLAGDAGKLVAQLESMLGEYERNGLAGEDARTVSAVRDAIAKLGTGEMKAVVDLLQKARAVTDAGDAKKTVSDAYASQKAILVQMQRLLAEHRRNQEALELSQALAQLADRQAANLQNGIELGKWTGGRKPEAFEAAMAANLEGQRSEQGAIAEELKLLTAKVAEFAKEPGREAQFGPALADAQRVQPSVESAAESLKAAQLFKAVTDEKVSRDALRKLAKQIAPPQNKSETLRQAERELAKMIAEQKDIAAEARKAAQADNFDQWAQEKMASKQLDAKLAKATPEQLRANADLQRRFNEERMAKAGELAALENNQGDLANKSDLVAQDVAKDAAAAAQALKAAQEKMQEARGALADKNAPEAAKNAQEAQANLERARAEVAQQAAMAEAAEGKMSGDPVKDLAQLGKQVNDLAQQQAAAAKTGDKAQQAQMAAQAQQLAQQAANQAPQAAPALQQAAAQAQQAAAAAQPQAMQQAAAQNLAQAGEQIAQQMAEAQMAQQQVEAAQQAANVLAELIQAEQKLEAETAKALAETKGKDFKGQAATQREIQTRTTDFKATLSPDLAAAAAALTDADTNMGDAKTALDKPEGVPARASEQKAIADLYRALRAVDAVMEQAQAQLGQPPAEAAAMAEAAAQLAEAAQQLAQANEAMQPGAQQMQQAAQQLSSAAAKAGEAAAKGNEMSEAGQAAAAQAAQALGEAAAQAAANNPPAAQAAAAQAQAALAQAQGSLAQAQAGLTPSSGPPTPGQGQPGPPKPGKPGSKPGPPKPGSPGGTTAAQKFTPGPDEAIERGSRDVAAKKASFAGLPPRDRAAIEQAQAEKYPEEFGAQVEQYLRNLADESAAKRRP